jgi:methylated-DNA-protein-cysteine methyltransferase related protein
MSYPKPDPETFYPIVWEIVRQIPRGQVATFGQLASMIPTPDGINPPDYDKLGPRWVGDAMNAVSIVDEPTVPWHRVINAKGGISLPEGSKGAMLQRQRLIAEGVVFNKKEVVDFNVVGWDGPDADWLADNGLLPPRPLKKNASNDGGQMPLF